MKSVYLVLALILSLSATTCVEASDEQNFQIFLGNLCEVNTVGAYASCCAEHNNGAGESYTALPACFGAVNYELTYLAISNKGLSALPSGVFSNFTNLQSLWLNGNSLTTLESGVFEGLSSLRSLLLSSNSITELPSDVFKDLTSLESLGLNANSLTKIATGTFEGLNNLASLALYSNKIVYLEENIFGSNTINSLMLFLQTNNLIMLPENFSTTTRFPESLYVYSNCLDCNRYSGIPGLYCYDQSDSYCPKTTNLCFSLNKFQKDKCFKCSSSDTDAFCDVCMPGYKHTSSGCRCVKCEEGESCVFGEVRVPSTVCAACSSSLPSECSSCFMDYKFVNGNCTSCGSNECCPGKNGEIILNCTSCNENRTGCVSCEVGTKYVPIGDKPYGKCGRCGDKECCVGKSYTEGCARCMDDMSGCKTCHMGYYPVNGECLMKPERECWPEDWNGSIKIDHCISCKDEEKGCALCDKEYRNQQGVCVEKGKYVDGGSMNVNGMMMMVMMFIVVCVSVIGWM